jgi:hypothetical protein
MDESKRSGISQAADLEGMGEFWDTHELTDFDTEAPDVPFEIRSPIPIELDLLAALEKQARLRGVSTETLINLWLHEKLVESSPSYRGARQYPSTPARRCLAEGAGATSGFNLLWAPDEQFLRFLCEMLDPVVMK